MARKSEDPSLSYIVLDERLKAPGYATAASAGMDLCACTFNEMKLQGRATVVPGATFTIGTGIKVHIGSFSDDLVGMVYPRSSLGRRGFSLQNTVGIIDADYQGEIILACRNESRHVLMIDPCERVAQLVLVPVFRPAFARVKEFVKSDRGDGGFGSSGKM